MSLGALAAALVLAVFIICLPTWRWSARWGYGPMLTTGAVLMLLMFLLLTGRIR